MKGKLLLATLAFIGAVLGIASNSAYAHDRRAVGTYTLIVGWHNEPTTEGIPNATFLRVFETATNRAVEGLEKTIRLTVRAGGAVATYEPQLRPLTGSPGSYVGDILPTRPGDYTFLVKGKIEQLEVNERFESGPGRFDVVRPLAANSYPDPALGPGELARAMAELRESVTLLRVLAIASLVLSAVLLVSLIVVTRRGSVAAVVLALAIGAAGAAPVAAAPAPHIGALVSAQPAPNARLAASPPTITLTFDKEIGENSRLRLLRPDGSAVATGSAPKVAGASLALTPPALAAGTYLVHYAAIDPHDGDEFTGYYAFAVGPDAAADLRGFDVSTTAGGLTGRLQIAPGRPGENSYTLTVPGVQRATLRFEPQDLAVGRTDQQLQVAGTILSGKGMELAPMGKVKVTALVRKAGEAADVELVYELTIPAPAAASPTPGPTLAPSPSPTPAPSVAVAAPAVTPAPSPPGGDPTLPALALAGLLALAAIVWGIRARAGRP